MFSLYDSFRVREIKPYNLVKTLKLHNEPYFVQHLLLFSEPNFLIAFKFCLLRRYAALEEF